MSLLEPGSGYAGLAVEYASIVSHGRDCLDDFDLDDEEVEPNVKEGSKDEDADVKAELGAVQVYPG